MTTTNGLPPGDRVVFGLLLSVCEGMGFTARQNEMLARLTRGLTRDELASEMGVSVATVDHHGREIRSRSGHRPRDLALLVLREAAQRLAHSSDVGGSIDACRRCCSQSLEQPRECESDG